MFRSIKFIKTVWKRWRKTWEGTGQDSSLSSNNLIDNIDFQITRQFFSHLWSISSIKKRKKKESRFFKMSTSIDCYFNFFYGDNQTRWYFMQLDLEVVQFWSLVDVVTIQRILWHDEYDDLIETIYTYICYCFWVHGHTWYICHYEIMTVRCYKIITICFYHIDLDFNFFEIFLIINL